MGDDLSLLCERLSAFAELVRGDGLRLCYHHHMGTVVQTEAEIDQLMARTSDAVALLLDTGHLQFAGGDPLRVIEKHGARIGHVHLKDVRARVLQRALDQDLTFKDAVYDGVFTVPGDGSIDFGAVLTALKTAGYAGWLVVEAEQDPQRADPLTYARRGIEHIRGIIE